jgi:hypothetical protein
MAYNNILNRLLQFINIFVNDNSIDRVKQRTNQSIKLIIWIRLSYEKCKWMIYCCFNLLKIF